jgi:hypothetical protein
MSRLIKIFALLVLIIFLSGAPVKTQAFWFETDGPLLRIDDVSFTEADFKNWWQEWRESDSSVPEEMESFINWQLLTREARKMELDESRTYKRKVEIFLKSRSLMLLRQEEIGGHMQKPEPGQLRAQYDATLQPIIDLEILQIADQETAEKILAQCQAGTGMKEAAIASGIAKPMIMVREKGRPGNVSNFFTPLFADSVAVGQFKLLQGSGEVWLLVKVVTKTAGSDADFAEHEDSLRKKFLRAQEPALNSALLNNIRQKYSPVVDEVVLAGVEDLKPGDPGMQETVLTIGDVEVPAWQVVRLLQEERKMYSDRHGRTTMEVADLKKMIIANIETQTMISLEARDRHYELKPPFKSTYDFYCQRRLIKEFEKVVIWPQVKVTADDIAAEYKRMVAQFSQADVVEVAWVQLADERLSERLTAELKQGHDFFKVMEPYFPQGVEYAKTSEDKLRPAIREIVATLAPGQVSAPIHKGENTFFVKLFRRFEDQHSSLEDVSGMLRMQLQEAKFAEVRNNLLATLKKRSKIVVKKKRWHKLRDALLKDSTVVDLPTPAQGEDK